MLVPAHVATTAVRPTTVGITPWGALAGLDVSVERFGSSGRGHGSLNLRNDGLGRLATLNAAVVVESLSRRRCRHETYDLYGQAVGSCSTDNVEWKGKKYRKHMPRTLTPAHSTCMSRLSTGRPSGTATHACDAA